MDYLANFRRLTAVEILDATFQLYRAQFAVIVLIAASVMLPTTVLATLAPPGIAPLIDRFGNIFLPIAEGAIAVAVVAALSGTPIGVGDAFRTLRGRLGTLIGISMTVGLLVALGVLLLVVPGILVFIATAVVIPVVAVEKASVDEAITRSHHLTRGSAVHVVATVALAWLLVLVLFAGALFGIGVLDAVVGFGARADLLLTNAVFAVVFPLVAIATTFLYLDLRVRRDGADIEALAAALPASAIAVKTPIATADER